ncbi:MAG: hypothetical protein K2F83_07765 [Oscillospiraceae bacterium]|nr:hypothetical protein [Oscillospiraceae bacterium]
MKKRVLSVLLALAMCLSLAVPAFAVEDEVIAPEEVTAESQRMYDPILPICYSPGDSLGATNWPSLSAAKLYYGTDFEYHYCGGGGSPYNYYYFFDDGTKMFFGVR